MHLKGVSKLTARKVAQFLLQIVFWNGGWLFYSSRNSRETCCLISFILTALHFVSIRNRSTTTDKERK
jgi:hypothetical protein